MPRLNKAGLVKELRISSATLLKYLLRPGSPPADTENKYDLDAVKLFAGDEAAKAKRGGTAVKMGAFDKLRQEKIRQEIEHSRFLFEKARGEYIHRSEIAGTIWAVRAEEAAMYRQKFEFELPFKYKGRTAVECQQMNADALDEIAKRVREGMLPLTGKEEPQSA